MWAFGSTVIIPLAIVVGILFYVLVNFLHRISLLYILGVWLAIVGTFFFSVQLHSSFVEAVKLGYPFFFIVLNMGLMATLTAYFVKQKDVAIEFEDILDAPLGI
jgi:hypothetical protein